MGIKKFGLACLVLLAAATTQAAGNVATFEGEPCDGTWFNDSMAVYCEGLGYDSNVHNVGVRYVYYSFEEVSQMLAPELEEDYDMVVMVNSAEGNTPAGAFIPNQHMMVLAKASGQKKMFTRDSRGVINGLARNVYQVGDIVGQRVLDKVANTGKGYGKVINHGGYQMVPVSTGASWHLLSFSGIFQVNWGRSNSHLNTSYGAPMSNQFYFGYYYHSRNTPQSQWTNARRERVSYAAVHGTPRKNWSLLGKKRASHGCARVHPYIQEGVRNYANSLGTKNVIELDWDFPFPVQDTQTPIATRKPILIIVFNSYDSTSI